MTGIGGMWMRAATQAAIEWETAYMRLMAVAAANGVPVDWSTILTEVEHRTWLGMTKAAAADSVYDDIAAARWRP